MIKKLLGTTIFCAGCLALAAQNQDTTTGSTSGGTATADPTTGSTSSTTDTSSQWRSKQYGATGRMGHHDVRASKIIGADVKSSSGDNLGKIEDVIVNPASGRIDFAVISYSGMGGTTTSSTNTTSASSTTSTASAATTGEKLVPVPWSMLRPSGMTGYASATTGGEQTFVFSGDQSKLQGAPSFDRSSWPDIGQMEWRQRVFSYFGAQGGAATGGAFTPGGTSTGSSATDTNTSSSTGTSATDTNTSSSTTPK